MTDCEQPSTYKSVLIHASAVEYKGKALVFLGPSGTGKSTISQLLAGTLEGARVLADDAVYLEGQIGGGWTVSDARPRRLQEGRGVQMAHPPAQVPLGGVFRLYQAPSFSYEAIASLETCRCLTNAFLEIPKPREVVTSGEKGVIENWREVFSTFAVVSRWIQGYRFYFSLAQFETLKSEFVYMFDSLLNIKGV